MSERAIALVSMNTRADQLQPSVTSPSAVPAAGGCSVFVADMSRMPNPTDSAAMTCRTTGTSTPNEATAGTARTAAMMEPEMTDATCPPITRFGVEAIE